MKSLRLWIASCESTIRPRNDEVERILHFAKAKSSKNFCKDFILIFIDSCFARIAIEVMAVEVLYL